MGSRVTDYQREQELVRSLAAFGAGGRDCSPDEETALPERRERERAGGKERGGRGNERQREIAGCRRHMEENRYDSYSGTRGPRGHPHIRMTMIFIKKRSIKINNMFSCLFS